MRVLQVDGGREWRGGQNQVRLLCRELAARAGVEVRLVTRRDSELARRAAAAGVAVREVPWSLSLDPRTCSRMAAEIASFRPHVVHAHDSHALVVALWARSLAGFFGHGGHRAPRVAATRRVDFSIRRRMGRSPWQRVDHVIAISEAVKAVLVADGLSPAGITVVPSGIDLAEVRRAATAPLDVRRRLGLPADAPLAVNVAALVDHKDQRTLIRAARAARALRPELHWAVAGEGRRRPALEGEIAALGLADRVHLLGFVEEADALIREAQVVVMSSQQEGLGSVVLHALALDKPVVATRGGGLPEMLPDNCLVPVGDAEALARRVVAALDHPAPVPLPPRFTAQAMAQGVLEVYRGLLPPRFAAP